MILDYDSNGLRELKGSCNNTTSEPLNNLTVTFDFYNGVGAFFATIPVHLGSVPTGGNVPFNVPVSDDVQGFSLVRVDSGPS
jgi:hypothetical protein